MYQVVFFLLNSFKSIKEALSAFIHRHSMPSIPKSNDVWIVEFPKSGITWLSFLIANVNVKMSLQQRNFSPLSLCNHSSLQSDSGEKVMSDESHRSVEVNFFNYSDFVPDIHNSRYLPQDTSLFPGYRFIKSHSTHHPFYHKVIYLIRDPRAVLVSYHKYIKGIQRNPGDLSAFIRSKRYGIDAWVNHVNSWIDDISYEKRIVYIRYEDLHDNTEQCVSNLYHHLGLSIPKDVIAHAVAQSSLQNMKEREAQWKAGDIKYNSGQSEFNFVGEGKKKKFMDVLSQTDLDYIDSRAGDLMRRFGY